VASALEAGIGAGLSGIVRVHGRVILTRGEVEA
jgi:hypothetical protein